MSQILHTVIGPQRGGDFDALHLKGARPAVLAAEQAKRFELVLDVPTAKTLGFTFPS